VARKQKKASPKKKINAKEGSDGVVHINFDKRAKSGAYVAGALPLASRARIALKDSD
jgi:hypothetical protein